MTNCASFQETQTPIKIGISTCLLGENVRYDGGHKRDLFILNTFGPFFTWVPVCPEVEVGMGIPREAVRLVGKPDAPRLLGNKTKTDWTDKMLAWAKKRNTELAREDLCGFIFKSQSPSSGMERVKIYTPQGMPSGSGPGMFAGAFMRAFPAMPVEEDGRLHDPLLRENFIERVFGYRRLKDLWAKPFSRKQVIAFHAQHKFLLLAHSPALYSELGRLVAAVASFAPSVFREKYTALFLQALAVKSTFRKHVNVLTHIYGFFKQECSELEKKDLMASIEHYQQQLVPLIVPVTLLAHYAKRQSNPYLCGQYYLEPHPLEMKLRNHV